MCAICKFQEQIQKAFDKQAEDLMAACGEQGIERMVVCVRFEREGFEPIEEKLLEAEHAPTAH